MAKFVKAVKQSDFKRCIIVVLKESLETVKTANIKEKANTLVIYYVVK